MYLIVVLLCKKIIVKKSKKTPKKTYDFDKFVNFSVSLILQVLVIKIMFSNHFKVLPAEITYK